MDIVTESGRKIPIEKAAAVERLISLKRKNGSNPWPAIEECIKIWQTYNPHKWQSYLVYVEDKRKSRKDPKYASTYDKKHGAYLRYTLDIPQEIVFMIRMLYNDNELPMNKEFFLEFGRKFPAFRVAQKL